MKKFTAFCLGAIAVFCLMLSFALADEDTTIYPFAFTAGTLDQDDYGYAENYKKKLSDNPTIQIRYQIVGDYSGFSNLVGYHELNGKAVARWLQQNSAYMPYHVSLGKGKYYAPCGRGNTKFSQQFGLTSVDFTGNFIVH